MGGDSPGSLEEAEYSHISASISPLKERGTCLSSLKYLCKAKCPEELELIKRWLYFFSRFS